MVFRIKLLLTILFLLGMLGLPSTPQSQAVSSFSATLLPGWISPLGPNDCSYMSFAFDISGYGTPDSTNGLDEIGFLVSDGDGTYVGVWYTYMQAGMSTLSRLHVPSPAITSRPITISIYDTANNGSVYQGLLDQIIIDPASQYTACDTLPLINPPIIPPFPTPSNSNGSSDAAIEREREGGIERVFADGIVVARQPNGDYHFYLGDDSGCLIGTVSRSFLNSTDANSNRTLTSLEGCGGYRVNVDATGYSACSIVLNMYGPGGYNRTHWLNEDFDSTVACEMQINDTELFPRCGGQGQDGCITGVAPSRANVVFINGIQNSLASHLRSLSLVREITDNNAMGIYNQGLIRNLGSVENATSTQTLSLYLALTDHPITLIGHSQGGAIIANALRPLEGNPRLNNVRVYTFGSPAENYPSGPTYRHCTFENDRVTLPPISNMRNTVSPLRIIPEDIEGIVDHNFDDYMDYYGFCTN